MRHEAGKKRVISALRFMENKEVGHLHALKRDEGPEGVMPPTSRGKLGRRKRARTRIRWKSAKDQCAEQLIATHQPNQVKRTPSRDEAT